MLLDELKCKIGTMARKKSNEDLGRDIFNGFFSRNLRLECIITRVTRFILLGLSPVLQKRGAGRVYHANHPALEGPA